mmetsp:Transcript_6281/g.9203  ORF Transcript_6281/g.9203 Transcript_6281/m.9203 type:complete len:144 (-) Transcript_6281:899-1330(-)
MEPIESSIDESSMQQAMFARQAFLSGTIGSVSSCTAKLCLHPKAWIPTSICQLCLYFVSKTGPLPSTEADQVVQICEIVSLLSRGASMLLVIVLNGLMLSRFLDGIEESGSVSATALSTAANFSFSVSNYFQRRILYFGLRDA